MSVGLRRKLRIETDNVAGRLVTRLFVGDDELPVNPELLRAAAQLAAGAPVVDVKRLFEGGVLERLDEPELPEGLFIRLDPKVALDVELRPGTAVLPHAGGPRRVWVRPEASLPLDLFVSPLKLAPTLKLARAVRTAWYRLVAQAGARDVPLDRAHAARALRELATTWLARHPEIQSVWDLEGDRLVPIGPLQDDTWHYPLGVLRIHADRHDGMAGKLPVASVAPDPHAEGEAAAAELAAFGRTLGALQRVAGREAVAPLIAAGTPGSKQLFRDLAQHRLAIQVVDRLSLGDGMRPGEVKHLGHATLLANLGGAFVLIDPWFLPGSGRDLELPPALCDLPPLVGIFFTHHHWDHVNLETLLKLDKDTPVYVPDQPAGPVVPRTARMLEVLGFRSVYVLPHGARVAVGQGGYVEAAPFTGEDPTGLQFGANTYVLGHGGKAGWVHVDSGPDRHGKSAVTEGIAAALRKRHGALSPIWATRRQERGTVCEYDWTFLLRPFAEWTEPTENCCTGASFLADLAAAAGATSVVVYSEGGADWYPESTDFLRRGGPDPMAPVYEDGWDTVEAIAVALGAAGATMTLSSPRDVVTIGT